MVKRSVGDTRAVQEHGRMTAEERQRSGGLVAPELVASTVRPYA